MNWEQKLETMRSMGSDRIPAINPKMRKPGNWFCSIPGNIAGDGFLTGNSGEGTTPRAAVLDAWNIITNIPKGKYLKLHSGRMVRWNGAMFADIIPEWDGKR